MKKIVAIVRWIIVLPLMIIIGGMINFAILAVFNLLEITSFGSVVLVPLQLIIFPFVIGYITTRYGPVILPKYEVKSSYKLFFIFAILQIVNIWLLTPNTEFTKDFPSIYIQITRSLFSIIGGIIGIILLKKHLGNSYSDLEKSTNKIIERG